VSAKHYHYICDSDEEITVRRGKKKLKILITGNVSTKMQMRLGMSIKFAWETYFTKENRAG